MNTEAHKRAQERLFESARAALLARVCTIHLPPSGPPTSAEPLPRPSRRRGRHHLPVSSHVTRFRSLILTVSAREASRGARLAWSLHLSRDGAQWLLWCAASLAGAVPPLWITARQRLLPSAPAHLQARFARNDCIRGEEWNARRPHANCSKARSLCRPVSTPFGPRGQICSVLPDLFILIVRLFNLIRFYFWFVSYSYSSVFIFFLHVIYSLPFSSFCFLLIIRH